MSDKALVKGRQYDTPELVRMGLLPPEWLREEVAEWPEPSVVVKVDHATRTVTFDSLPHGGDGFAPVDTTGPRAHKTIHDYQEQLKAKRKRRKGRR